MNRLRWCARVAARAVALAGSLSAVAAPQTGLEQRPGCFISGNRTFPVSLEIARTFNERQRGLMERTRLAERTGMLFIYDQNRSPDHGFWMYNTLIPLDIAYLSSSKRIVNIQTMTPCASSDSSQCPTYPAGKPFRYAIEMNSGYFETNRIDVGDRLLVGATNCQD
ncbi:MAG: DUF192 domain-containing protein [Gammaproteobacteria bacterium]|nr:MAG: DUF192 domain-containing protein [Gammaproteobacteria bacterium]